MRGWIKSAALYDWNYQRHLLSSRRMQRESPRPSRTRFFRRNYLLSRPLLAAIRVTPPGAVDSMRSTARTNSRRSLLELCPIFHVVDPGARNDFRDHDSACVLTSNGNPANFDRAAVAAVLYHYVDYPTSIARRASHGADRRQHCVSVAADRAMGESVRKKAAQVPSVA